MKKIILVGMNAKYIHSNLAIRYMQAYAKQAGHDIEVQEYTINQQIHFITDAVIASKPDFLGLSCYIWNIEMMIKLAQTVRLVLPKCKIILGGPEVSYEVQTLLEKWQEIDGIIFGEGEETLIELLNQQSLNDIKGLAYKDEITGEIKVNGPRTGMAMDRIPFVYDTLTEFENRIIYYESSRGCPYHCQYCLSSIEKGVRFRSLDLVLKELRFFLDHRVMQVKFVDRTFNAKKSHALAIWRYLHEHDNGVTNFHFEITGDILDEEMLEFLKLPRPGLFQFEIGVQSTNMQTIVDIDRKVDFETLAMMVKRLKTYGNIHLHLDLIAGLPRETYQAFEASFNDVMSLEPEQLQLGFLKVLKGAMMKAKEKEYHLVYRPYPPYEILSTDAMSYKELSDLKMIEEMLEVYYNSGNFRYSIKLMQQAYSSAFSFYEALASWWVKQLLHESNHTKIKYYEYLLAFAKTVHDQSQKISLDVLEELLVFDLCLQEKPKKYPNFYHDQVNESQLFFRNSELIQKYLKGYEGYTTKQISRMAHIHKFSSDVVRIVTGNVDETEGFIIFDYMNRDVMNHHGQIKKINNQDIGIE